MLFFYLVAKTAHIPRIGPEVLFFFDTFGYSEMHSERPLV